MQCNIISFQKLLEALWLTIQQLLHTCLRKEEHVFARTILIPPTRQYYCIPPYFVDILKTATNIILLKPPNFTDY